jgi:hypothetical protein
MLTVYIRIRHSFSSGSQPWEYQDFYFHPEDTPEDIDEVIQDFVEQYHDEYAYATHRHQVDFERIERPPVEWVQEQIKVSKSWVVHHQHRILLLEKILLYPAP